MGETLVVGMEISRFGAMLCCLFSWFRVKESGDGFSSCAGPGGSNSHG